MSNYKSYYYKSLGLSEDSIPGGKGDETKPSQVDKSQLEMGIKVEMEHTKDAGLAKEIALDHLTEDPQYYSKLKDAGIADELKGGKLGESNPMTPMLSRLMTPKISHPSVIAVGVRGTKTGLLPAGGIVDDPEKARLGGLELVKNLKPNSQGAIANTPASDQIKADGGHFTPDNKDITKGGAPKTSKKGDDTIHPFQTQQLGNKPFEDDGTTRDGEHTPEAAGGDGDKKGGDGRCGNAKASAETSSDKQDFKPDEKEPSEPEEKEEEPSTGEEPRKGPWGIELDVPEKEDPEKDDEEGKDVSIDIKETLGEAKKKICFHCKKPRPCQCDKYDDENREASDPTSPKFDKARFGTKNECATCGCGDPTNDHVMRDRFQQLANIKKEGWAQGYTPEQEKAIALLSRKGFREVSTFLGEPDANGGNMGDTVTVVLQKKQGPVRLSCEVDPDGSCNGLPVEQFIATQVREAGLTSEEAVKQLQELVGRLNAKGTVTPLLAKAQKYLKELDQRKR